MADEVVTTPAVETSLDQGRDAAVAETSDKKDGKVRRKREKKNVTLVRRGMAYIQATYNNTQIIFTDPTGALIAWSSAGVLGFKGPKKATPYAATLIVRDAAEKAKPYGLKEVQVFVKGVGSGRESAVRALNANGLVVLGIKDTTPIPHNGPRAPRPRRV